MIKNNLTKQEEERMYNYVCFILANGWNKLTEEEKEDRESLLIKKYGKGNY